MTINPLVPSFRRIDIKRGLDMKELKGLIDCHTHTRFSVDSEADEIKMIDRAIGLGLKAYAVTDHCEVNRWFPKEHYGNTKIYPYFDFKSDYENSVAHITELKERYSGKTELICGIELGQAQMHTDIAETVVGDGRVDFIIGSLHQLPDMEDFAFIDFSEPEESEIYGLIESYFTEIYKLCRWGKFDVLGHLTYFLRYINGKYGRGVDISRFDDMIAESFRELIAKDKGIEINTSGLWQGMGKTFPTLKYVRLFKDLGGKIISLGSDAHTVENVGSGIAEGAGIAKQAGFDRIAYFKKHEPVFIQL